MTRLHRILLASDLSKASSKAFAAALALAKTTRASLTILNVLTPLTPMIPGRAVELERLNREMKLESQRRLTELTARAKTSGIRAASVMVEGEPARQIVRVARSKRADLIVVGTHGRTGLDKFFLGSVAQRVVTTAPCPVMTVRSK
jgi:nucleotide-binding universal stress UspA family protein